MRISELAAGVVLASAVVALAACPPFPFLELFNNSGQDLEVVFKTHRSRWEMSSVIAIGDDASASFGDMEWVNDPSGRERYPMLVVDFGDQRRSYPLRFSIDGAEFVGRQHGRVVRRLQMNPDRRLYLVRPAEPLPSTSVTPQPEGMPIDPQ